MKRLGPMSTLPALVVTVAMAACTVSPSPSPSLAEAMPSAPSPSARDVPTAGPSGDAAPTNEPTSSLATSALVLGGTWVTPTRGARLTSYTTTLSASPTASGPGVTTFTKVVFSGTWAGAAKTVMCKATRPADSGDWQCRADLLALGVPPGQVTFSFDVYGEGVPTARSPDGPRRVIYAVPPPKPTDPRWRDLGDVHRLRWSAPPNYADAFLVYNTWECPRATKKNAGTPCFVAGTPVDVSQLDLLDTEPGDARSAELTVQSDSECGPVLGTVLLRARNTYGGSAFTIVTAALVPDPNDIIC